MTKINQTHLSHSAKSMFAKVFESWLQRYEHSINDLSVSTLSTLSGINRVTFYYHFSNIVDFIKWYLHKDLIFRLDKEEVLRLEKALDIVYEYINQKRKYLRKIFASKYRISAVSFIENEAYTYQLRNFDRLDPQQSYAAPKRSIVARFYASGITHLILRFIEDDEIISMGKDSYLSISQVLVKNYIERILMIK